MIFLLLFVEFAKIGLFSFGGGYATLPFLYHMSETYGWFSIQQLTQMLAISSITPGPVGLNVATFAGFKTSGIIGSLLASLAIMLPSFVFVILVSKVLKKFRDNVYLNTVLYILRPTAAALLTAVLVRLFFDTLILNHNFKDFNNAVDFGGVTLLIILILISLRVKKDPLTYLLLGAFAGVVVYIVKMF